MFINNDVKWGGVENPVQIGEAQNGSAQNWNASLSNGVPLLGDRKGGVVVYLLYSVCFYW